MSKNYVPANVDDLGVVQSLVMGGGPVPSPDNPISDDPPRPDGSDFDVDE